MANRARSPGPPSRLAARCWLPFRRRWIWLAIGIILLFSFWRAVDNWLGKRAWECYAAEFAAHGIRLDWEAYIPPHVPDDGNFALTPSLAPLYDFVPGTQHWRNQDAASKTVELEKLAQDNAASNHFSIAHFPSMEWPEQQPMDLAKIMQFSSVENGSKISLSYNEENAACILLKSICEVYGGLLAELKTASEKPFARFNVRYDHAPLTEMEAPHMSVIRQCVKVLALRAGAQLALENPDGAFDDLKLALYLSDIAKDEPMAGSNNRRLPCRRMINSALLSGLNRHRWTSGQLQWFQSRFEKDNFPLDGYRYLMAERAHYVRVIDQVGQGRDSVTLGARNSFNMASELEWDISLFMVAHVNASGWFYRQAIHYSRSFESATAPMTAWLRGDYDAQRCRKLLSEEYAACIVSMPQGMLSVYRAMCQRRLLTALFLRDYTHDFIDNLRMQTQTEQAAMGCALERYFLFHNHYPDKIEELIPGYLRELPVDPFAAKPFHYRRNSSDSYTLYSVGANFIDDGGKNVFRRDGRSDQENGDLVWQVSRK